QPIVFFWDELPLMLKNIKERHDEDAAMELLDTLRAVRQTHKRVRMFFTGSIGLHNVITSLRKDGYVNAPINDMHVVELPPLALADAAELARRLLEGEGFQIEPADPLPQAIARAVDRIPYYIHHVVDEMRQRHTDCTAEGVEQIVSQCLTASQDSWELDHYRTRISGYYDEEDRPFVLGLLDVLAGAGEPLHFPDLFNLLKSQIATEDEERARDLLTLLRRDHYVAQEDDGRFRFRYPLIQRWWRLNRGLTQ
ncbi:MAG: ATP-binding protein, partial [Phycisphaerae bacterium]